MRERQRLPPPQPVPPSSSEEALQQAQAEGLVLRVADSTTGYFSVCKHPGGSKPYQARVWRGCKSVLLGYFATVEEAALCVARFPDEKAEAWAQLIQNDEVDGWSMELGVSCAVH